jgi:cation diffusion facilitator family transporter
MHHTNPARWLHAHNFAHDSSVAERRTWLVIGITATMMVVEIIGGIVFHSMAVLADGWHMGTHVSAFLIAAVAYAFARRHAADPRYSFGTGKMNALGGFASAVVLSVVAFLMAGESAYRFFDPIPIHFTEALGIAVIALLVNLVCALLLNVGQHPAHAHHHDHDPNLRAAYLHVLADALTTFAAIFALLGGKFFSWVWLDPVVGLAGSVVVFSWAYSLLRDTSGILLDRTPDSSDLPNEIRKAVESDGDSVITDLHIWQVSAGRFAAALSIVAHEPKSPETYRQLFRQHDELVHVTIEVQECQHSEEAYAKT